MPSFTEPLLRVSPIPPIVALEHLRRLLDAVAHGAFGQQSAGCRVQLCQPTEPDFVDFQIELTLDELTLEGTSGTSSELALIIAETALGLIRTRCETLRVAVRQIENPCRRMLMLPGLTWHRACSTLVKIFATLETPTWIELASLHTALCLRIAGGRPLGNAGRAPELVCSEVVDRRTTSCGGVVRLRSGRTLMSIVVPSEIDAAAVAGGSRIYTAPVVGLIPRRLVQVEPCQLPLFSDC